MSLLNDQAFLRYQRQIALAEIGEVGQYELNKKHVLMIGCGGLGTAVSLYLAGAGIGSIILVDHDAVEISNLHRQIAYRENDLGTRKVCALADQLRGLNQQCRIRTIDKRLEDEQLQLEVMLADVVIDCSDNFPTRHQINRICYQQKTPLVSASAIGWDGQLSVHRFSNDSPCYRCLVGDTSDHHSKRCHESGVLGPVVGTMASLQALQVIQELLRNIYLSSSFTTNQSHTHERLTPHGSMAEFFHFDGRTMQLKSFHYEKDMACPVCGFSVDDDGADDEKGR
ncbi:HesA/MoeB/ThiF family protein [Vibrio ruber]|uniref:HesA/MoeB/ThiF family protein n=1 Tax=Vibrio ruber TaxID=184755 RepID=UPI002892CF1F|nr:HesA/MoeB/ThiF family protein [Vibrio ruber]WNJ96697.1 HesA/MoeB/ThiF family protein [Vibrio ruber]